jgi:trk system potassium uptake protein TrkA
MNIVIAGDGEVGFHLARLLEAENHDITVIDPHQELLKMLESHADIMTIAGDSTSISVLESANINKVDLLISVVHDEKVNITTCILAKKLGAKSTIARINNTEFLTPGHKELFKSLGIDGMVCPERIAAKETVSLLTQSAATEVFAFSKGKLSLYLLKLDKKAAVLGQSLDDIARKYPNLNFRAVAIKRGSKTIIPKGKDSFQEGDLAYVISKPEGENQLFRLGGKQKVTVKNAMIIGGGRIGRKTARELEKQINIKLLDIDKERCHKLADSIRNTLIINGDARDVDLLEEEGIRSMDAFIAVTDDSETNIFTCLLAKKFGVPKVIPLVENVDYIDIAQNIGIDTIINKKLITASYIVRFTKGVKVTSSKCLHGMDAEVLEFVADADSPITHKPIRKLRIPKGAIIGGIVRGDESFIALGNFQIQEGDKVVVFSLPDAITRVEELFKQSRNATW